MKLDLNQDCLLEAITLVYQLTGITLATSRSSMIEGRLRKRVHALNLDNYHDYLKIVKIDKNEQEIFVDLVTTNETYFYRTPRIWDYIEKKLLPSWFQSNPKAVFTAWSAAASSGEEAHTLAILCQAFKDKNPQFIYQIIGTDISKEMVDLCKQGQYIGRSIDSFSKLRPDLFGKYLKKSHLDFFEVLPEIKSRLKFYQHNILKPLSLKEKFDLVLVRNVFIYFKGSDQEKSISQIATKMADDGTMIIGESESLNHINTSFVAVAPLIYRQKSSDSKAMKVG